MNPRHWAFLLSAAAGLLTAVAAFVTVPEWPLAAILTALAAVVSWNVVNDQFHYSDVKQQIAECKNQHAKCEEERAKDNARYAAENAKHNARITKLITLLVEPKYIGPKRRKSDEFRQELLAVLNLDDHA